LSNELRPSVTHDGKRLIERNAHFLEFSIKRSALLHESVDNNFRRDLAFFGKSAKRSNVTVRNFVCNCLCDTRQLFKDRIEFLPAKRTSGDALRKLKQTSRSRFLGAATDGNGLRE